MLLQQPGLAASSGFRAGAIAKWRSLADQAPQNPVSVPGVPAASPPNTDTLALGLGLGLGLGIPIVAGMVCLFTRGQYSFGRGRSMLSGNAASFNDDRGQGQPSSTATRAAQSNTMRTPQPNTNPMSQPQPRSQTGGYTDSGAGSLRASHNAL